MLQLPSLRPRSSHSRRSFPQLPQPPQALRNRCTTPNNSPQSSQPPINIHGHIDFFHNIHYFQAAATVIAVSRNIRSRHWVRSRHGVRTIPRSRRRQHTTSMVILSAHPQHPLAPGRDASHVLSTSPTQRVLEGTRHSPRGNWHQPGSEQGRPVSAAPRLLPQHPLLPRNGHSHRSFPQHPQLSQGSQSSWRPNESPHAGIPTHRPGASYLGNWQSQGSVQGRPVGTVHRTSSTTSTTSTQLPQSSRFPATSAAVTGFAVVVASEQFPARRHTPLVTKQAVTPHLLSTSEHQILSLWGQPKAFSTPRQ